MGWNDDRHACKVCVFRAKGVLRSNGIRCDFIGITNHSRGCPVEDCDKFVKGRKRKRSAYGRNLKNIETKA